LLGLSNLKRPVIDKKTEKIIKTNAGTPDFNTELTIIPNIIAAISRIITSVIPMF
jgi:hypothetical protein